MNTPNELLREARRCIDKILRLSSTDNNLHIASDMVGAAEELAVAMDALDSWLISGGTLPEDWNVRQPRHADVEGWDMSRQDFQDLGKRFTRLIPDYDRGRVMRHHRKSG